MKKKLPVTVIYKTISCKMKNYLHFFQVCLLNKFLLEEHVRVDLTKNCYLNVVLVMNIEQIFKIIGLS